MWLWYQWKMWLQAFCALRSIPALPPALKHAWQRRALFKIRSPTGPTSPAVDIWLELRQWHSSQAGRFQPTEHQVSAGLWKEEKRAFNLCACNICQDKVWMEIEPHHLRSRPPTLLQLPWNDDSPLSHATNRDACFLIYTCSLCLKVSAWSAAAAVFFLCKWITIGTISMSLEPSSLVTVYLSSLLITQVWGQRANVWEQLEWFARWRRMRHRAENEATAQPLPGFVTVLDLVWIQPRCVTLSWYFLALSASLRGALPPYAPAFALVSFFHTVRPFTLSVTSWNRKAAFRVPSKNPTCTTVVLFFHTSRDYLHYIPTCTCLISLSLTPCFSWFFF